MAQKQGSRKRPANRPAGKSPSVARSAAPSRPKAQAEEPTSTSYVGPASGFPEHAVAGLWAAFVVLSLDALGLLVGGIYLATRSTDHEVTNHSAALTQAIFALLGALIFAVLARGALPRRPMLGIRTPAMILEFIFIPVSIGLFQSGRPGPGAPLLLSALVCLTGLILGFRRGNTGP